VTWKELIRRLTAAGFVEQRTGKGSHRIYVHPTTGKRVVVTMHGHDAGYLGNRILRDAGIYPARKP
jgi:predicted RNA binding protein YcfA (HicA-like mRNA interferase family)